MTERHAILTAIRENPDEDLPRLIYADWLEERDGEEECSCVASGYAFGDTCFGRCLRTGRIPNRFADRAELVRVQIELAKPHPQGLKPSQPNLIGAETREFYKWGKRSDWGKRQERLRRRELEVLSPGWVLGIPSGWGWTTIPSRAAGTGQPVALVRRGIVELVASKWEDWREHGDLIWERELPWKVRLTTMPELTAGGDIEFVGHTARTFRYRIAGRIAAVSRKSKPRDPWVANILRARWPGIEFELPPVGSRGPDSPQLRWRNFAMRYEDLPRG